MLALLVHQPGPLRVRVHAAPRGAAAQRLRPRTPRQPSKPIADPVRKLCSRGTAQSPCSIPCLDSGLPDRLLGRPIPMTVVRLVVVLD